MNRTFRTLLVVPLVAGGIALAVACSSSSSGGSSGFGEACNDFTATNPCSGTLLCRCALTTYAPDVNTCFCTQSCEVPATCPNDAGSCLQADDPASPTSVDGLFCFNIQPDGGPL